MIRLRSTRPEDIPFVLRAEGDAENARFILPWPESRHGAALANGDIEHLIVEEDSASEPVGFVILAGLEGGHRSVEFRRIVITEKGRGYGRGAIREVKRRAFSRHAAHRLWLDVKEPNTRARDLYESEGFRVEGTLRDCLIGPEGFESLLVMSILEHEWTDR